MTSWQQYIKILHQQHQLSNHAIESANRLLKHEFLFDNPYAMEPTQESYVQHPMDWQVTPNGDPEWLFMLKRQEYLVELLEAYYETDNTAYRDLMKHLLFDWIDNNLTLPDTWRTIDTGIRLLNWTAVIGALQEENQLNADEQQIIDDAVRQQAEYLRTHYTEKFDISNWGVLITTGILVYAARFPKTIEPEVVTWAQSKLDIELDLQVDADGNQWEQSPLYLLEVWRSVLSVYAAQTAAHQDVTPIIVEKSVAMTSLIAQYLKPDMTLVQQGDTDRIRIDSLYNVATALLNLPTLANMQEIFDFGLLALANRTLKFPEKSEHLSTSLLAFGSGNAFWRSSWQTNADYLHIYNGNLGSGHGHAALGHIDLVIDGQDVLVDPGRYTYVDGTERRYLKSPSAHNVMTVDHQAFSRPKDSWKYAYVATPLGIHEIKRPHTQSVVLNYFDSQNQATVTRYVISIPEAKLWATIDMIRAQGHHQWQHYWQIAPQLKVLNNGQQLDLGEEFRLATTSDTVSLSQTLWAPRYNQLEHLSRIETEQDFMNFGIQGTVVGRQSDGVQLISITPTQSGSELAVTTSAAWGINVKLNNGDDFLITLQPDNTIVGRKLFWFDGIEAYGTLNVFKRHNGNVVYHEQIL